MQVTLADKKDKATIGEMTNTDEPGVGFIAEMITDPVKLDSFFPGLKLGAKGAELATACGDDAPEFPIVRVEEGWSNSKRLWGPDVLQSIAEQVNENQPVAHLGHIKAENMATEFPEPQTTWLGAIVKEEASQSKDRKGQMVKVAYFAGYNLPGAKVRTYIKSKAVRGISWWGPGEMVKVPGQGVEVKRFTLKALDWARKLSEGMSTSSIVGIASEMEEGNMEKSLAAVTPEEFEKENPNGYALIVAKAVAEKAETIGEQEAEITELKKDKDVLTKIREALGLDEDADPLEVIASLAKTVGEESKKVLDAALDKVLAKKVPDEKQRSVIRALMPVGEMEEAVKGAKDDADAEKIIGEMTTKVFDEDDNVKTIIGEQTAVTVRRRESLRGDQSGKSGDNSYITRERVTL